MTHSVFNRETLLDVTVNVIPLFILAFFLGVYLLFTPFEDLPLMIHILVIGLHVVPFTGLVIITYLTARRI